MTLMDESKAVSIEALCPLTANPGPETAALAANGAYTADVLRIVRGTPNAEELAALVAALLLTRRVHDQTQRPRQTRTGDASGTVDEEHHRPSWLREGYTPPAAWTAGP